MVLAGSFAFRAEAMGTFTKASISSNVEIAAKTLGGYSANVELDYDLSKIPGQKLNSTSYVTIKLYTMASGGIITNLKEFNCFERGKDDGIMECPVTGLDSTTDWTTLELQVTPVNVTLTVDYYAVKILDADNQEVAFGNQENDPSICYSNFAYTQGFAGCNWILPVMQVNPELGLMASIEAKGSTKYTPSQMTSGANIMNDDRYAVASESNRVPKSLNTVSSLNTTKNSVVGLTTQQPEEEGYKAVVTFGYDASMSHSAEKFTTSSGNYVDLLFYTQDGTHTPVAVSNTTSCLDAGKDDGVMQCTVTGLDPKADYSKMKLEIKAKGDIIFSSINYDSTYAVSVLYYDEGNLGLGAVFLKNTDTDITCYTEQAFSESPGEICKHLATGMNVDVPIQISNKVNSKQRVISQPFIGL